MARANLELATVAGDRHKMSAEEVARAEERLTRVSDWGRGRGGRRRRGRRGERGKAEVMAGDGRKMSAEEVAKAEERLIRVSHCGRGERGGWRIARGCDCGWGQTQDER